MKSTSDSKYLSQVLLVVFISIMAILPIHAVISTWLTSNFGYEQIWQSWKEILLFLSFPLAALLLFKRPVIAKKIFNRRINQLILLYGLLHLVLWVFRRPEIDAAVAGIIFNLRFLAMFVLAQILILSIDSKYLKDLSLNAVKIGGLIVVGFGFLQLLVLPDDFLSHFGYGPDTIEPYSTIDQNQDFVRINSTLRGPNPLGLYLILFTTMTAGWWVNSRKLNVEGLKLKFGNWQFVNRQWVRIGVTLATALTLYGSFSRSAWLGAAISIGVLVWLGAKAVQKKRFLTFGLVALGLGAVLLACSWQSDFVQNTILHQDPGQGPAINSTEAHWQANQRAIDDIIGKPLGGGPGSAGPASFYTSPTKISENYFLQIGQEVGILGLILFVMISVLVANNLWLNKTNYMPRILLASIIGLTVSGLFLHTWANEVIAMTWWGLAGLWINEPI